MDSILTKTLAFLLCSSLSWGAITYDNSASQGIATGNFSYSLTIGASASYLFVAFDTANGVAPTSVKCGVTAMTQLKTVVGSGAPYLYGLKSPPTGAQTIAITFTSNISNGWSGAISLIGTDTSTDLGAIDATGSTGGGTATPGGGTVVVNTATDWSVDFIFDNTNCTAALTAANGQTIRQSIQDTANGQCAAISTKSYAATGTQTLQYNNLATGWDWLGASIKVSAGAATVTPTRTLMGVGL